MRIRTAGAFFALILVGALWAADIDGTWRGDLSTPDGSTMELTYKFKQDGAKLTGSVALPQGDTIELSNGKIEGDKLSFLVHVDMNGGMNFVSEGTVKGDEITLSTKAEGGDQTFPPMTLKRQK